MHVWEDLYIRILSYDSFMTHSRVSTYLFLLIVFPPVLLLDLYRSFSDRVTLSDFITHLV